MARAGRTWPRPPQAQPSPWRRRPATSGTRASGAPPEARPAPPLHSAVGRPALTIPRTAAALQVAGTRYWRRISSSWGCTFRSSVSVRYIISNWLRSVNKSETTRSWRRTRGREGAGHSGSQTLEPNLHWSLDPGGKGARRLPGAPHAAATASPAPKAAKEEWVTGSEVGALAMIPSVSPQCPVSHVTSEDRL